LATDYSQFFSISPAGCGTLSGCALTKSGGGSVSGFTVGTDGSITVDDTDSFSTSGNISVKMNCAMNGNTYTSSFKISVDNYCKIASNWVISSSNGLYEA
jgi:hypothetical protein